MHEALTRGVSRPRKKIPLNFQDGTDYDPDRSDLHETFSKGVSRTKEQSTNLGGSVQSLTDCPVLFCFRVPAYSPHSLRLSYARWRDLLLKEVDKTCSLVMRARGRSELEEGAIRDKLRRDQREQKAGVLWNSVLPKPTRPTTQPTTPWDIVKAAKQLTDVKP